MSLFAYGTMVAGIAVLGIGAGVLWSDPKRPVRQLFFFFTLGLGLWGTALGLLLVSHNFLFNQFIFYAGFPIFGGLFLLILSYPHDDETPPWAYGAVLPGALIAALAHWNVFVSGMTIHADGSVTPINGPMMPLFLLTVLVYFVASLSLFGIKLHHSRGQDRLKMWYLALALFASSGTIIIADIMLPTFGNARYILLGPLSFVVMSGILAYAIMRHELMDIKVVIERGVIYTLLIAIIIGCYLTALDLMSDLFGRRAKLATAIVVTIVGIFSVPRIERWFRRISDRVFFKDRYDYAQAVQSLSEGLSRSMETAVLVAKSERLLALIFRASYAKLAPAGTTCSDAVITVPIEGSKTAFGTLAMGPKRSGDAYTAEDRQLLKMFAEEAAIALERAELYGEVSRHAAELEERVAKRTKELRQAREREQQIMFEIAHGIITPLAVFQTKLEELKQVLPKEAGVLHFEHSIADLSTFVSGLLKLARLESQGKLLKMRVDLSVLLADIVGEMEIIAAHR